MIAAFGLPLSAAESSDTSEFLWVTLFRLLGCERRWERSNEVPGPSTWARVIGDEPALILLDDEARAKIADTQRAVIRAVDEEITRLGIEHDGDAGDLRLLADAPNRWPHGYKVDRAGEVIEPTAPPYTVTCPQTGWQVPMIETRQVSERHGLVLDLVPEPAARRYHVTARSGADEETWKVSKAGTVIRARGELFLVHNPGTGEVRVRIANRAKAYLYCVEVEDPNTDWRVPLAPSWVISKNYRTVARLFPDPAAKRFAIEIVMGVDDDALEAATSGTVDGDLNFELDGRRQSTSIERLRGEVRLRSRYRDPEEEARDRQRFASCRNRYSEAAANDLRPWEKEDIVPRPGDILQERLYAVQWLTPDGRLLYSNPGDEDLAHEREVEDLVRANLIDWQVRGLVPNSRIEPGYNTTQVIRERAWTHWHHLFTPRHLFIGAMNSRADDKLVWGKRKISLCAILVSYSKLPVTAHTVARWAHRRKRHGTSC